MNDIEARPEPDAREGVPHPRFAKVVVGHDEAKAAFAEAQRGAMPHAWLMSGPEGIGKATLAWSFARDLLGAADDPSVASRLAALSEPRLALVRRGWDDRAKRLKSQITVDEVRALRGFLSLAVPDGGHRIVLIDSADDMNTAAANAVLKLLEEPPARTVFLVISHNPARLLPTIRSRCRALRLNPLSPDHLATALETLNLPAPERKEAVAALAGGSVGRAASLLENGGLTLYDALVSVFASLPNLNRQDALALASRLSARGADSERALFYSLLEAILARLARQGVGAPLGPTINPQEEGVFSRLAPGPVAARAWADLASATMARVEHATAVNLDPGTVILDTLLAMNETAGRIARP